MPGRNSSKKTVVLGASPNPARYSYLAVQQLHQHGHEVIPIGIREGSIDGITIITGKPEVKNVDTLTLYLNPARQKDYYGYILDLHPERIIFNPGTENDELEELAQKQGISTEEACTLVLLSTGQY